MEKKARRRVGGCFSIFLVSENRARMIIQQGILLSSCRLPVLSHCFLLYVSCGRLMGWTSYRGLLKCRWTNSSSRCDRCLSCFTIVMNIFAFRRRHFEANNFERIFRDTHTHALTKKRYQTSCISEKWFRGPFNPLLLSLYMITPWQWCLCYLHRLISRWFALNRGTLVVIVSSHSVPSAHQVSRPISFRAFSIFSILLSVDNSMIRSDVFRIILFRQSKRFVSVVARRDIVSFLDTGIYHLCVWYRML